MMNQEQLDRIEALLVQSNDLKKQAFEFQKEIFEAQKANLAATSKHIENAKVINEGALEIQRRARALLKYLVPALVLVLVIALYLNLRGR